MQHWGSRKLLTAVFQALGKSPMSGSSAGRTEVGAKSWQGKKNHVLEYTFPGCFKLQTHRFTLPVLNCLLVVFNDCWWNEKFHAGSMSTSSGWFLEYRHEKSSKLELSVSLLMVWWSVKLQCSLYLPTDECLPLARSKPFLGIYFGFLLICFKGIIIFFTLLIILLFLDLF